jgi:ATP-binding cassette subfamily B protein
MLFGKYLNKYYLKNIVYFLIGVVALVMVDYVQLYLPEFLGGLVDLFDGNSIVGHEDEMLELIKNTLIVAGLLFIGRSTWRLTVFRAENNIEESLRNDMFAKAERLSQRYYHENKVGTVLNWFSDDVSEVREFIGWGTVMTIDAIFLTVLAFYKMISLNWFLTLIAALPLILIAVWGFFVEKFEAKMWKERQEANDRIYEFANEGFTGLRVIKAFVKENQQILAFAKIARKSQQTSIRFQRVVVLFGALIEVIIAIILCLIIGFGSWIVYLAVSGETLIIWGTEISLTAGSLITFIGYFDTLIWPMIALGQIFSMRSRAKASYKRIAKFLDENEEVKSPENAIKLRGVKGDIEFKNFSFKYEGASDESLKKVNLNIKAGESIGIVGKIGSGKSTLVNVLLRLSNFEEGTVFVDGVDLMKCDIDSLRKNVAIVPQDNFLFSDEIENNIAFSDEEGKDPDLIKQSAVFSCVAQDINDFKDKYKTVSGERGVTLSGGQKQRISIARAYYKNSPILILDDSVSAVDTKTEETILSNIKEFRNGKTTILVSSRISTVSTLDRIIVLNDGEVEGFDSHENLLKKSPTYQKMVYLQELEKEIEGQ